MQSTCFEQKLIQALEFRGEGILQISGDWIPVTNSPNVRVLKIRMEDTPLVPLVYPEEYEHRYQAGEKLEELAGEILEQLTQAKNKKDIPMDFFQNFEGVKERIFIKLINADKNRVLLKNTPHIRHEDLAAVFYYEMDEEWLEDASILIRNEHLELWEIKEEELKETAWKNTLAEKKPVMRTLSSVLEGFGLDETEAMKENPLYILSNEEGRFGAACALYPGALSACAKTAGCDLILLPCSIHEWLLLPTDGGSFSRDPDELRSMVREINQTQVADREVLSDEVYYYNLKEDRMRLI